MGKIKCVLEFLEEVVRLTKETVKLLREENVNLLSGTLVIAEVMGILLVLVLAVFFGWVIFVASTVVRIGAVPFRLFSSYDKKTILKR